MTVLAVIALAWLLVWYSLLTLQTWEHRRFALGRLAKPLAAERLRRTLLVVPCKGQDLKLAENLSAHFRQAHGDYRVRLVVEDAADEACAVIREVMLAYPGRPAELVVAGRASGEGQKVHNLRVATAELPADCEVLAFADSDARPEPHWLAAAGERLSKPGVGAVTGYRWFVPQRASLANFTLASLNAAAASMFGPGRRNFVWGGAWAIERAAWDKLRIGEAWRETLSDDLVATAVLRQAGLAVEFEPRALVMSPLEVSTTQAAEFVRRQLLIGRFYAWGWWWAAASVQTANAAAWAVVVWATCVALPQWQGVWAIGLATVYGVQCTRGYLRQSWAREAGVVGIGRVQWLARQWDIWAWPVTTLCLWGGLAASSVGSWLTWRGIGYQLARGGRVVQMCSPVANPTPGLDSGRSRAA